MLDFLPQKNKRQVTLEYILRGLIFLLVAVFLGLFLLILLFIPSAIFSKYESKTVANQLDITESLASKSNNDVVALVKKLNSMADILERDTANISDSGIIDKIISLKNNNISISSFSISAAAGNSQKITISGIASTRDDLTSFNKALVDDGTFTNVDLPVSYLINNTNANFSITLVYDKK